MSLSIQGKTAIVTGAANGLGLAIARHFIDRGANVMFADIDEARLEAEIGDEAKGEGPLRMFAGDLCQKLTISNLLSATMDAFGRIDILVNAARQIALSDPLSPDSDNVEALFKQNVMTGLRLSQQVARRMIAHAEGDASEAPGGVIVNVTSTTARQSTPDLLGFSLASAGVEQMTRGLALSLAPKGIRVNAVAVGSVLTSTLQAQLKQQPELRSQILAGTPLGRIAPAAEVAETVQYLASDASAFMTGQVLRLDGGRGLLDAVASAAH
ncbi:oxidoreductase [Gemmobacter aquaticus]|uniref:Oxidoreductase n=1 Tax=Gemmobacter aquaticus TaxID=490185 RepID=A0A917YKC9_9RHOB|nr:SDR family oxidoreductase [Gemmobacter aquaticus]GGO32696.1 oxidoreductase [Gemmobacter aquaticus]